MTSTQNYQIVFNRTEYKEIISKFFSPKKYTQALEAFQKLKVELEDDLKPYCKSVLINRIAASASGAILFEKKQNYQRYLNIFYQTLQEYLDLFKQPENQKNSRFQASYINDPASRWKEHLQLTSQFYEKEAKEKVVQWGKEFLAVNKLDWNRFVFDTLLQQIHEERINFANPNHLKIAELFCHSYLELTESEIYLQSEKNGRVSVLNLLGDIAYFGNDQKKAKKQALEWAKKSLSLNPNDEYAKSRKKLLEEQEVLEHKIARFEHDANSTIGTMRNLMNAIRKESENQSIEEKVARMENCIDRLFAMNRIMQGVEPELQSGYVEDILVDLQHSFSKEVELQIDSSLKTLKFYTNKDSLRFVLENLIKNAFEAFQRKKLNSPCIVQFSGETQKLLIQDNSGGIEEKYQNNLFDAYQSSKNEIRVSSGLGLFNSRKMMEMLKGTIELADTQPSKGTCFVISFPKQKKKSAFTRRKSK
ncbi:MAG: signal transduction histidine kinase [bacterium]|jgi:signal transduction histidine kinase